MAANPPSPAIFNLNDDILLYIFKINGDMFCDEDALDTTRITSQVCHSWRSLMLATTSLWAKLIDMDRISDPWSEEWRHELIRRSGTASLSIRATSFLPSMDIPEFFDMINKNWHRIQLLIVSGTYSSVDSHRLPLDFPAPQLETFDVTILREVLGEDITEAAPAPLFGNHAPMLRDFHLYDHFVDHRSPWLRQLHFIELGGPYSVQAILGILSETKNLQELIIFPRIEDHVTSVLPAVSLPHLNALEYRGDLNTCAILLDRIKLPLGCELTIGITDISTCLGLAGLETLLFVVTMFTDCVKRFLKSNVLQLVDIQYLPDGYISFEGRNTCSAGNLFSITLPLYGLDTSDLIVTILSKLALLDLSRTTTLQFNTQGPLDPCFQKFFSCLPSLDTICIDSSSLEYVMLSQNDMNATNQPSVIFPLLGVIELIIVSLDDGGCQPVDQVAVAAKFILSRVQNGHPISLLDMGDTLPFQDTEPNLDALVGVKDLKIFYLCSLGTETYGYIWSTCDTENTEECIDKI